MGKSGKMQNVLAPQMIQEKNIKVIFTDRGGDVTYHGPGQVVAYPIIDLRNRNKDVHQYVHDLEEVVIRTLHDFSIKAHRDDGHAGVWVNGEEIAAIGLSVRKCVSMHGLALNVNTELRHFMLINPCGFSDRKATSMANLLDRHISMKTVAERFLTHFAEIFGVKLKSDSNILARDSYERETSVLV